jgi:hypothetical protein
VIEGSVRGGAGGQVGRLLVRAHDPHSVQQRVDAERVVEGDGQGGAGGQVGRLLVRAGLPQGIQQPGDVVRIVEGNMVGSPLRRPVIGCVGEQGVPAPDKADRLRGVSLCGGVLAKAGGGTEQAAVFGGCREGRQAGGGGEAGCGIPEAGRGDAGAAGAAAVLVQVVGEPVGRPPVRVGAGAGADAGQRAADALAWGGGVSQGLLQPFLAEPVPFGVREFSRLPAASGHP